MVAAVALDKSAYNDPLGSIPTNCPGAPVASRVPPAILRTNYGNASANETYVTNRAGQIGRGGQADRIYSPDGKSVNLSANGGGRGAKTGLYCVGIIPESIKPKGNYLPRERVYSDEGKFRAVSTVNNQQPSILQNSIIRKLTPIECERLQSLPDNYTDGISNTQRYKALGNAFNKEVIKHILKALTRK